MMTRRWMIAITIGAGALATPASAGFVTSTTTIKTVTETPTTVGAWGVSLWSSGASNVYWRPITITVTGTSTTTTVQYSSLYNQFFGTGGVVVTSATGALTPYTYSYNQYENVGIVAKPPPATPPPVKNYTVADPPPTADPQNYFYQMSRQVLLPGEPAGTTLTSYLSTLGSGYLQASSSFASLVSDFSAVDDPYGLKSKFMTDFSSIQSDLSNIGTALTAGIPTSGTPFSSLGSDLTTFAGDLSSLPGGGAYVAAAPSLIAAAMALDDAANQVNTGIAQGSLATAAGSQFITDLSTISGDFLNFSVVASAPEPPSLALMVTALFLSSLATLRHRRRLASRSTR